MLAKWITFDVDPGERETFCVAEAAWTGLTNARGFLAQVGGWLDAGRTKAGILSLWTDVYRYQTFMRKQQRAAKAARTYAGGRMVLATQLMYVDAGTSLLEAAARAGHLRISDCSMERSQMGAFLEHQRIACARSAGSEGFLSASVLRVQHDDPRILVASFWEGAARDAGFTGAALPSYRTSVATQTANEMIVAQRLGLVDAWRVIAA